MLMNMLKRIMIYGYLLFVGYQAFLLIQSGADKKFPEIVDNFEKRHSNLFNKMTIIYLINMKNKLKFFVNSLTDWPFILKIRILD